MPPRYQSRPTDLLTRVRNEMDALGRPGMAGLSRLGGNRGRGFGQASVVADGTQENDEGANGAAQLLAMSVSADSIASGGDTLAFDTIIAQHGFDEFAQPSGGYWVHPVSGVYGLILTFEWDTYEGGGAAWLELDGDLIAEGELLPSKATGRQGFGFAFYEAEAGSTARVKVTQTSGSAQTCAATVEVAITDPDAAAEVTTSEWSKAFTADVWGITQDGTYWWTTEGNSGLTVTQRNADGSAVSTFEASDLLGSGQSRVRGIAWDGTHLWCAGANEILARYTTAGVLDTSFALEDTSAAGHSGVAWDGTHVWVIENDGDEVERYTTAGVLDTKFSLPSGNYRGMTFHDGDLWIVESNATQLLRYTAAGSLVSTVDLSGVGGTPFGVWIAADGTLYVAVDGDGVYVRATAL